MHPVGSACLCVCVCGHVSMSTHVHMHMEARKQLQMPSALLYQAGSLIDLELTREAGQRAREFTSLCLPSAFDVSSCTSETRISPSEPSPKISKFFLANSPWASYVARVVPGQGSIQRAP